MSVHKIPIIRRPCGFGFCDFGDDHCRLFEEELPLQQQHGTSSVSGEACVSADDKPTTLHRHRVGAEVHREDRESRREFAEKCHLQHNSRTKEEDTFAKHSFSVISRVDGPSASEGAEKFCRSEEECHHQLKQTTDIIGRDNFSSKGILSSGRYYAGSYITGDSEEKDDRCRVLNRQQQITEGEIAETSIGVFGDFCLLCGEMMDSTVNSGNAYCSAECELNESMNSAQDWWEQSFEGYHWLSGRASSTAGSSAPTSPPSSPRLGDSISDRLAILCSGPPACPALSTLDLGERLLGAGAVAKQYLDHSVYDAEEKECPDAVPDIGRPGRGECAPAELRPPPQISMKASPSVAALSRLINPAAFFEHSRSVSMPASHGPFPTARRVSEPTQASLASARVSHAYQRPVSPIRIPGTTSDLIEDPTASFVVGGGNWEHTEANGQSLPRTPWSHQRL